MIYHSVAPLAQNMLLSRAMSDTLFSHYSPVTRAGAFRASVRASLARIALRARRPMLVSRSRHATMQLRGDYESIHAALPGWLQAALSDCELCRAGCDPVIAMQLALFEQDAGETIESCVRRHVGI